MAHPKIHAAVTGWGMAVPDPVLTNADLEQLVDTSDEWIVTRTGIRERRIAGPRDSTTSLGVAAARKALERAERSVDDIDLIICATCTPDQLLISEASLIQAELGGHAGVFDVGAACSGFVYALSVGAQFIQNGAIKRALVIGVDTLTRFIDFTDRSTCVLFGDGAGAVVIEATTAQRGLLSTVLGADGSGWSKLYVPGWQPRTPDEEQMAPEAERLSAELNSVAASLGDTLVATAPPATTAEPALTSLEAIAARPVLGAQPAMKMQGNEVYKFAVRVMGDAAAEAVERAGLELDDIDLFIPHQANLRIINAAGRRLNLDPEKVFVNVDRYGNTSAASVPIALSEAADAGLLEDGDHVAFVAFGGGLSWAAGVVRWGTKGVER
jgi:3-oxoacyl-[acyl-carrier-protein] synthase-3